MKPIAKVTTCKKQLQISVDDESGQHMDFTFQFAFGLDGRISVLYGRYPNQVLFVRGRIRAEMDECNGLTRIVFTDPEEPDFFLSVLIDADSESPGATVDQFTFPVGNPWAFLSSSAFLFGGDSLDSPSLA